LNGLWNIGHLYLQQLALLPSFLLVPDSCHAGAAHYDTCNAAAAAADDAAVAGAVAGLGNSKIHIFHQNATII